MFHPDVITRSGSDPRSAIDTARKVTLLAAIGPLRRGPARSLIFNDFNLVQPAGPAGLKTIEEPPSGLSSPP